MSILNAGPLAILLERLTAARAAFLDAAISTRAAAATALSTADWTSARAAKLDNLDASVSTSGAAAPTALSNRITANTDLYDFGASVTTNIPVPAVSASTSTTLSWTDLINVTDSGVIELLPVYQTANAGDRNAQLRLTIDGTQVYLSDTDFWQTSSDNNKGTCLAGLLTSVNTTTGFFGSGLGAIPFKSTFVLDFRIAAGSGTVTIETLPIYHTT